MKTCKNLITQKIMKNKKFPDVNWYRASETGTCHMFAYQTLYGYKKVVGFKSGQNWLGTFSKVELYPPWSVSAVDSE